MISLKERHQDKETHELVHMIEHPEDYTEECIEVIHEIFNSREVDSDKLHDIAVKVNTARARKYLLELDPLQKEIKVHKSHFLKKEKVKKIYKQQLQQTMEEKKDFRFDVWSYAIGAI
ncbi:MAG: hypothetical protein AAGG68_00060 [Bacteroidota bacterium]